MRHAKGRKMCITVHMDSFGNSRRGGGYLIVHMDSFGSRGGGRGGGGSS